jgi:hypothetical protein
MDKKKEEAVEVKGAIKVTKAKPLKSYVAVLGFDTSDNQRFEEGDEVVGIKEADLKALIEMNAIAEAE